MKTIVFDSQLWMKRWQSIGRDKASYVKNVDLRGYEMEKEQAIIQFLTENEPAIKNVVSVLVGGGIIWKVLPWGYSMYTKIHSFDIAMNRLNKQNKILAKRLGTYIDRPTLDAALNKLRDERYRVCAISGPAGSGKTRFALNVIKRNNFLSKYYYVYINKSNADYFDSAEFKNLRAIQGNRNYVFIVDYVYENVKRINSLIKLTEQTQRHKFILIERDYDGLRFPKDYEISMVDHKMDLNALCEIFLNTLPTKMRVLKKTQEEAKKLIELIYGQIDLADFRPVFAELSAKVYLDNPDYGNRLLESVSNYSDLIKLYWNYKVSPKRLEDKCLNYNILIDEAFMANIDILVRSLLLVTAVTKKDIIVEINDSNIKFTLNGALENIKDITRLIQTYCEKKFIESIGSLQIEGLREVFGVILKDSITINKNRRDNKFNITAQLDIVSEWLMSDSLTNGAEHWINYLRLFLKENFNSDLCRFMARGAIDFPDLIQYFETSLSSEVDSNEYLAYIYYSLQRLYEMNEVLYIDVSLMVLNKFIRNIKISSPENFRIVQKNSWKILKEVYSKNSSKKDLTRKIIQILEGEMDE